jgi:hypothetical protein
MYDERHQVIGGRWGGRWGTESPCPRELDIPPLRRCQKSILSYFRPLPLSLPLTPHLRTTLSFARHLILPPQFSPISRFSLPRTNYQSPPFRNDDRHGLDEDCESNSTQSCPINIQIARVRVNDVSKAHIHRL